MRGDYKGETAGADWEQGTGSKNMQTGQRDHNHDEDGRWA